MPRWAPSRTNPATSTSETRTARTYHLEGMRSNRRKNSTEYRSLMTYNRLRHNTTQCNPTQYSQYNTITCSILELDTPRPKELQQSLIFRGFLYCRVLNGWVSSLYSIMSRAVRGHCSRSRQALYVPYVKPETLKHSTSNNPA